MDEVPKGLLVKQPTPANIKPFPDCWFETTLATFEGYVSEALAKRVYKIAPPPLVVNRKGLEGIQETIDLMRMVSEKGQEGVKLVINRENDVTKSAKTSAIKLVVERP